MNDRGRWNPYLAGALTGVLFVLCVLLTGQYFGASTSFVRAAGMMEEASNPQRVEDMGYFLKYVPQIDWQFMFVIGIFFGAFIAAATSGNFKIKAIPDMWYERFGDTRIKRAGTAFIGGVIAIFGARLAGGCPSGHGLSGLIQMSLSGYIAIICFFIGGVITAKLVYKGGR